MANGGRAGIWTRAFGGPLDFQQEIAKAQTVEASWVARSDPSGEARTGHTDIVLLSLPGWHEPLWAADDRWLYLRRPEGVWKTAIDRSALSRGPSFLVDARFMGRRPAGRMMLGPLFERTDGWRDKYGEATTALDMDAISDPSAAGVDGPLPFDYIGQPLIEYDGDAARLIAISRDEFRSAPTFRCVGDWLIATSAEDGLVYGYPLERLPTLRKALNKGHLWIRYQGEFMEPFEVEVAIGEAE